MISKKKKSTSYSFKNLLNAPKNYENTEIQTSIFKQNSFKLKQNKSINNLINFKKSNLITIGKTILTSHSIFSNNKNKPKIHFNKLSKRKTPINYELINSCKLAIYNSRKTLTNFKEIFKKINKEFNIKKENEEKKLNSFLPPLLIKNSQSKSYSSIKDKNNKSISLFETNENNNSSILNNIKNKIKSKIKNQIKKEEERPLNSLEKRQEETNNNSNEENKNIINCILTPEELKENAEKLQFLKKYAEEVHNSKIKAKRKRVLMSAIRYLSSNNIKIKDFINNNPFPKKPFELPKSEEFIEAVKFNNLDYVKQALENNKNLIFQFDYFKQTSFHWAAKLGNYKMLKFLLENDKTCNLYDKKMRTPIYLASLNNHYKCVELLLKNGGNAFIRDVFGKKPSDVTSDQRIKDILLFSEDRVMEELEKNRKFVIGK